MSQQMFSEAYLNGLPKQPLLALARVCKDIRLFHSAFTTETERIERLDCYLEALGLMKVLAAKAEFDIEAPEIVKLPSRNIENIIRYCIELSEITRHHLAKLKVELAHAKYAQLLGEKFSYHLTGDEVKQAQALLSELKQLVESNERLDDGFKQRLQNRLEVLHFKIHLKMESLDRWWGLLGDAGIVLRVAGDEAAPIVARIRSLISLAWQIQARNEHLSVDVERVKGLDNGIDAFLGVLTELHP